MDEEGASMASQATVNVEIDVKNLDEVKAALEELERHRAHEARARAALADFEHFKRMTRADLARVILRADEQLRDRESALSEQLEQIEALEEVTHLTRQQALHLRNCDHCDYGDYYDSSKTGIMFSCPEYREIGK
jgi:hypothetical protein